MEYFPRSSLDPGRVARKKPLRSVLDKARQSNEFNVQQTPIVRQYRKLREQHYACRAHLQSALRAGNVPDRQSTKSVPPQRQRPAVDTTFVRRRDASGRDGIDPKTVSHIRSSGAPARYSSTAYVATPPSPTHSVSSVSSSTTYVSTTSSRTAAEYYHRSATPPPPRSPRSYEHTYLGGRSPTDIPRTYNAPKVAAAVPGSSTNLNLRLLSHHKHHEYSPTQIARHRSGSSDSSSSEGSMSPSLPQYYPGTPPPQYSPSPKYTHGSRHY
ncbi:hypothetical protein MKEN_00797700 [Mycena kentingensis (nom. inval.)]|nr:hypothetical protein MKEN_00797700 [Mycena kentingensis (nom. inval.)]